MNLPFTQPPAHVPTTFLEYLKSFGPGLVAVLTWLGSGDIVSAGVSGGNYGYALTWAMIFALLMRYFFVSTIAKYQLCNPRGEAVLDGLTRLHPLYPPFLLVAVLGWGHLGGTVFVAGLGETSVALSGVGNSRIWAVVWVVLGLLVVFRPLYNLVEALFKVFLVLLSVSLCGTAIWVGADLGHMLEGTLTFRIPEQQGPFGATLVAMSMVGAVGGSLMNLVYPYFLEAKGWNGPQYRRLQTYDFALAVAAMIIFNLAVWTLGAELLFATGQEVQDLDDLTRLLASVLGESGRWLFLLGVFAAVYTSLLGQALGLGLLGSHAVDLWRKRPRPSPSARSAHPVYTFIAVWSLVSPLVWVFAGELDFVGLTLFSNTLLVLLIPLIAGGLWWITADARFIGEEHRNRWWENALMALLFGLAIWGTWAAGRSAFQTIGRVMG